MAQDMFDYYQTRFIRALLAEKAKNGSTREKRESHVYQKKEQSGNGGSRVIELNNS